MTRSQVDFDDREPEGALEQAGFYLMILDERVMTPAERAAFEEWLNESELHRHAFKKVASVWGRMDVLKGLAELFPFELMHTPTELEKPRYTYLKPAIAACFAAIVGFGAFLYSSSNGGFLVPEESAFSAQIVTAVGEIEKIDAADGSIITVNTDSSLSVSMDDKAREVRLEKGEAYFEVEHDPERSFDVLVNDTIVRAIGTAFSVQKDGDEIQVIVTEGVVEILDKVSGNKSLSRVTERELLHPGQLIELNSNEEIEVKDLAIEELGRQHTWREGMLVFDGESLVEVVAEFSRYNNIQMDIIDDSIRDIRVGGYFNSSDVAGMLNALEGNFGVKVTYLDVNRVQLAALE